MLELEVHCYFVCILFLYQIFSKCNFRTYYNDGSFTIVVELLKFRNNNSRIIAAIPGNLLRKM